MRLLSVVEVQAVRLIRGTPRALREEELTRKEQKKMKETK